MRAAIQRVREAVVTVDDHTVARIGAGLLVLCGVAPSDSIVAADWLAHKIVALRIFDDDAGVMNRSVRDSGGEILAVSQFTLHASTKKGARPSYSAAAPPEVAQPLFQAFVGALERELGREVPTGVFGAHMLIALTNDGPVTLWIDSETRE
ncbi:MAG TPA: D-aminoacyl-tRNA deacylase [Casimicrobiaceae bacterium]|jgi:D-tyrosyl-tRNA(Tyr) deacylase|nr:D-aminoacyl-tRNA deacylase [Casimicrobiaceae bacterium]